MQKKEYHSKEQLKITDVFSYLPRNQIDIEQLEEIFIDASHKKEDDTYKVIFNQQGIILSTPQMYASMELESRQRKVAYILKQQKVIAIIGYDVNSRQL